MTFKSAFDPQDPFIGGFDSTGAGANSGFTPSTWSSGGSSGSNGTPPTPTPALTGEALQAAAAFTGATETVVVSALGVGVANPNGLTIDLVFDAAAAAAPAAFQQGIEQAAMMLAETITDKITVNLGIDYSGTGGGASAGPAGGQFEPYSTVRADLTGNATKGDPTFDALPTGSTIAGQSEIAVWDTQLKLWGLLPANSTEIDGNATFATDIASSALVGVALHELTHAMGRVPYGQPQSASPDIFDFFRFTSAGDQLISDAIPAAAAYFSVDGGKTDLAAYGLNSDPSDFLNTGAATNKDPFDEFYTPGTTLQSLTTLDKEQLDALGFHLASPVSTTIQTDTNTTGTATSLVQLFSNYYFQNASSSGQGVELQVRDAPYVAGHAGAWAPIGVVQTATGYEVVWESGNTDQYVIWETDSNGNRLDLTGVVSGTSTALEFAENVLHQNLNGDGTIGIPGAAPTSVIQTYGSTSLAQTGANYFLVNDLTGSGPELTVRGAAYVAGHAGAWAPIGAEQTANGYEVAWELGNTNQYVVWDTDSNGNRLALTAVLTEPAGVTLATLFGVTVPAAPASPATDPAATDPVSASVAAQVAPVTVAGSDNFVFAQANGASSAPTMEVGAGASIFGNQPSDGSSQGSFQWANGGHDTVADSGHHDGTSWIDVHLNAHLADLHANGFVIR